MVIQDDYRGPLLDSMNRAAHRIDPQAQPFSTSNAEAVALWARGDNEHAVALDPDFGPAWLAWTESLSAHGQTSEAIAVATRGLERPTLRSPVDRVSLEVLSATLRKDVRGREKALMDLSRLAPADTTALDRLALAAMQTRDFKSAAAAYRKLLDQEPTNTAALLALGYAQAYSGDLDAARRTFEDYGTREGQKTNSFDSLGEACFMNGRFADAQKYFLAAYQSNPKFVDGTDLEKAAYAQWLAGDLKKADVLMSQYLDARRKAGDTLVAWREACWFFSTGRRDQAVKIIQQAPPKVAQAQVAIWNANEPADIDRLKQAYEASSPSTDGFLRTFYAAALLESGNRDQARELIARWPLPVENGSQALYESLIFPKFQELREKTQ